MATRILLVDDEPSFLSAISRMLSSQGYEVLSASGPRQALDIIKNNSPIEVVVCDVAMPEMRGTELVREIGQISPQTARLLMTGSQINPAEVPEDVPVIRKPVSLADLILAVRAALERSAKLNLEFARSRLSDIDR